MSNDENRGVYKKFHVSRVSDPEGKHTDCWYFVLDPTHDEFSIPALKAYAAACKEKFPDLALDLEHIISSYERDQTKDRDE